MFQKQKKGLVKLLVFAFVMIFLSAGLGVMILAQSQIDSIVDDYYDSSVDAATQARIAANTNTFDFNDWNDEINIVILVMIIAFFAYAIVSSYLNDKNSLEGILNFFLLIVLLAVTAYLGNVNDYIWSLSLFDNVELNYSALIFYFEYMGRINLLVGVVICILTVAPKTRREKLVPERFG
jgi:multisubunit Na+/H+ antiporter MnhG subunit